MEVDGGRVRVPSGTPIGIRTFDVPVTGAPVTEAPKYPRIPYLWAPDGGADNVLPPGDVDEWLDQPVTVEEKLDGANVALWVDDGRVLVASRGGVGSRDRSGQLGRLRAWAAERSHVLAPVLQPWQVLYGEWLWLTHSVHYDRLPDWLVLLDVWSSESGWADAGERRRLAAAAALTTPPVLFTGRLRTRARLMGLIGPSTYGVEPMEGVVIRADDGRLCKVVRPGFPRLSDHDFAAGRPCNQIAR